VATEQKEIHATPGNSGAWYLELVGVEVPDDLREGNGNGSVGQLWDAKGGGDILDGWAPEALSSTITGSRTFRWTVVAGLLVLGVLAVAALLVVPNYIENQANDLNQDYRQALLELNADLAPTQVVLESVTDAESITDLGAASSTLSAMSESSAAVTDLARAELPSSLPLTPRDSLQALQPARDRMIEVGAIGGELARRITRVAEYDNRAADILDMPALPRVANDQRITNLSVALAGVQAETAAALSTLPDDAALASHKVMATDAQRRLSSWQTEYLEALRIGDRSTARSLVNEVADLRDALDRELIEAKSLLRAELDGSLVTLAMQIEATLILLPR
jgi:hypothetical protein